MTCYKMNKKLIPIKIHYFLYNAGIAPLIIFGPTIAKQIGYSSVTVGCMYTILPLFGIFLKTTFGAVADKFRLRKFVFILSVLFCLISVLLMIVLTTTPVKKKVNLLCHNATFIHSCNEHIKTLPIDRLSEIDPNGVINCEFLCPADSEFMHEICSTWKEANYCTNPGTYNTLNHYQTIKNNYVPDGKLSSTYVEKIKSVPTYSQNFTFKSSLHNKHIFKMNNCMYARIEEIQLTMRNKVVKPTCEIDKNISCIVRCDSDKLMGALEGKDLSINNDLQKFEFWVLFLIYLINWTGMVTANSMTDTVCIELLENEFHNYGRQRMYGCIGFGLSSLACGRFIDIFSTNFYGKHYNTIFYFMAVILTLDIILISFMKVQQKNISVSIFKNVRILFYDVRIVIFAIWCILTGIISSITWNFLYWYLEDISTSDELKWSKTLQGIDTFITTFIGELPFFFISGWILKKIGHSNSMSLVLFACMLRMFGYSLLPKPIWVLPIDIINGFAFCMCYVVIVSYSSLITVPGTESTVQALFSALFDGLGLSLGGLLGGFIKNEYGGRLLYTFFGFISFVAFVLHSIILLKLKLPIRSYNQCTTNNTSICYSNPNDAITILEKS